MHLPLSNLVETWSLHGVYKHETAVECYDYTSATAMEILRCTHAFVIPTDKTDTVTRDDFYIHLTRSSFVAVSINAQNNEWRSVNKNGAVAFLNE